MLTAQQALDHLLSHAKPVAETESVPMQATLGRVLAENVNSLVDVPPLDNTSMDGYAVRTADTQTSGSILKIAQRIPGGLGWNRAPGGNCCPYLYWCTSSSGY
jgi:molybdopterin molybdotransferase